MNKRVVRRLLETFFRRGYLYLLPLVLFTGVGAYKAMGSASGYRSIGVVDVSSGTLLSQLTSIRGENFGYESPAASTARTINGLLRTGHFTDAVAENAGVTSALQSGQVTYLGLQRAVYASAADENLLNVIASTASPELSARLVTATIEAFIDYVVAGDVAESAAAEDFFRQQLSTYQVQLDKAQATLDQYLLEHPGGDVAERPPTEQAAIERLQSEVAQARDKVTTAEQKIDEARLATEQATHDVQQRLRIVDEPEVALAPQPRMRQAVMTTAIFVFVGLLLSIGAVVLATVVDRSLWSADDVEHLFRLPVLAVVPTAAATGRGATVAERAPFTSVASPVERGRPAASSAVSAEAAPPRKAPSRTPARSPRRRPAVPTSET